MLLKPTAKLLTTLSCGPAASINSASTFSVSNVKGLDTNLHMPWEIRVGASWINRPDTLFTVDLSILGPSGSKNDPWPLVEREPTDPMPGLLVPEVTYRKLAVRGAVGFEQVIADHYPLRGGFLMEQSSAPSLPSQSDIYIREKIDTFGLALSMGLRGAGFNLSFGVTGLYGHGSTLALRRDNGDSQRERMVANFQVGEFAARISHQ